MAVTTVGQGDDNVALSHLEKAAEGFLLNWRYHFIDHPALWSLRDEPRYQAIIAGIETKMAEQRQASIAGTADR
jgi:isochorismate hydrolase